jgi:hypothetical protein
MTDDRYTDQFVAQGEIVEIAETTIGVMNRQTKIVHRLLLQEVLTPHEKGITGQIVLRGNGFYVSYHLLPEHKAEILDDPEVSDDERIKAILDASPEEYWQPILSEVRAAAQRPRHATLLNHQAAHLLFWATIGRNAAIKKFRG